MRYRTATPVNRSLGTWSGQTPTDPTLVEPLPPTHGRQDTPTADEARWMIGAPRIVGGDMGDRELRYAHRDSQ